jgi:hypothetical protein
VTTFARRAAAPSRWSVSLAAPITWGLVVGAVQAASPLLVRWLDPSTVYALEMPLIAGVYIGFAVADGRTQVLTVECAVAGGFVALAAAGVTGSAWLLVAAYMLHGVKDYWQHRTQFVANTRWWPPFCASVDLLVAAVLAVEVAADMRFHA